MKIQHCLEKQISISKTIFCDDYVIIKEYSVPVRVGTRDYEIKKRNKNEVENYKKSNLSVSRTRMKIHELISCNVGQYPKFLTLTSAKTCLNVDDFRKRLKSFFKSMKNNGYDLKYLYVLERQKKRGKKEGNEGSWHAHIIIFNDEYIPFEIINKYWNGNTDIKILNDYKFEDNKQTDEKIKNVASYVVKYITKDNISDFGSRFYACSRNLKRPVVYRSEGIGYYNDDGKLLHYDEDKSKSFINNFLLNSVNKTYQNSYCYMIPTNNGTNLFQQVNITKGKVNFKIGDCDE